MVTFALAVTKICAEKAAAIRPSKHSRYEPRVDLFDVGQLRLGWMCHRAGKELCKIGVGDERAGRVENQDDTVLSRPLRLDEIAESVELEIGGKDAGHLAPQGCANRNHRCADTKRR